MKLFNTIMYVSQFIIGIFTAVYVYSAIVGDNDLMFKNIQAILFFSITIPTVLAVIAGVKNLPFKTMFSNIVLFYVLADVVALMVWSYIFKNDFLVSAVDVTGLRMISILSCLSIGVLGAYFYLWVVYMCTFLPRKS